MTETEGKIMKKILIATTALVATAGVAAADVNLSGYARFGIQYNENRADAAAAAAVAAAPGDATPDEVAAAAEAARAANPDTRPVSRVRFQLDASTTTDAGMGLNVRQRIQSEENGTNGTNGGRFGLTYGGLAVNVGNINGVIESTPNLYMRTNSAGIGLEGNSFHSLAINNAGGAFGWTAYSSGGAGATDGAEVIYSANGLRLHVSDTRAATAYGASYAMGDMTVAFGYEDIDAGGSITLITAGMNIGQGWAAIAHGINENAAGVEVSKTSLKGGYDVAPGMNVYGFVASEDAGNASGVGMSYDLGGGASFDAGYTNTAASTGILSAGVFFTF
jgi:outer membrane protein OmpU